MARNSVATVIRTSDQDRKKIQDLVSQATMQPGCIESMSLSNPATRDELHIFVWENRAALDSAKSSGDFGQRLKSLQYDTYDVSEASSRS
jgi:hypothetical protein